MDKLLARDRVIIRRVLRGDKKKDIAADLGIAQSTVSVALRRNGIERTWGRKNLKDKDFEDWHVVQFHEMRGRVAYWWCVCKCGTERAVSGAHLRDGSSTSCGCGAGRKAKKEYGHATKVLLYHRYKARASKYKLEFTMLLVEFIAISVGNCYYCGAAPSRVIKSKCDNGDLIFNGVDRVDSNGGYTIDNVVPCCCDCNKAKAEMSQAEFMAWLARAYNHFMKVSNGG